MKLRIVDLSAEGEETRSVRVEFDTKTVHNSYIIDDFCPPLMDGLLQSITQYYGQEIEYFVDSSEKKAINNNSTISRLIAYGQQLGDSILGEDHELLGILDVVSESGYDRLDVTVESKRGVFFENLWEILVAFESKHILSSMVRSYCRSIGRSHEHSEPIDLRLSNASFTIERVQELLAEKPKSERDESRQKPFRLLHIINRAGDMNDTHSQISELFGAYSPADAIVIEPFFLTDREQLAHRISVLTQPIHAIHYDGPVFDLFVDSDVSTHSAFDLHDPEHLFRDCINLIIKSRVPLFAISATSITAPFGLDMFFHKLANFLTPRGIPNIVGLNQATNPWIASQCFAALYTKILAGFSLRQAVIEARKLLQRESQPGPFRSSINVLHLWPLLLHYSAQDVIFFSTVEDITTENEQSLLAEHYAKQHGFMHEFFPERSSIMGDRSLLKIISKANFILANIDGNQANILALLGDSGLGKTTIAHHFSYYLVSCQSVHQSFFFDFNEIEFTVDDIKAMLSSTVEGSVTHDYHQFERVLGNTKCLFVFDNILAHLPVGQTEQLERQRVIHFIARLHAKGHVCLLTGTQIPLKYSLTLDVLTLEPISSAEAHILCYRLEQKGKAHKPTAVSVFPKIIEAAQGNPWLLEKFCTLSGQVGAERLAEELSNSSYASTVNLASAVETFFQWRWSKLDPIAKDLLLLCEQTPGLVLEMLFSLLQRPDGENTYALNLLASLGHGSEISADRWLASWQAGSFVKLTNVGTKIEPSARVFLRHLAHRESFRPSSDSLMCFSLIIGEAIRTLSGALINKPNPLMTNYLILNRRSWVQHFERIWFSEYYSEFFRVKGMFKKVMQGAGLADEVDLWAKDLLERTMAVNSGSVEFALKSPKACSAWLQLATDLLERGLISLSGSFDAVRSYFYDLVAAQKENTIDLELMDQVFDFLEVCTRVSMSWQELVTVCESAVLFYWSQESWYRCIKFSRSQAAAYFHLNRLEQATEVEQHILCNIPFSSAPRGFEMSLMLNIALDRLYRKDESSAQGLIAQIKLRSEADQFTTQIAAVENDLALLKGNFSGALPYYCRLWNEAFLIGQSSVMDRIEEKFKTIRSNVGAVEFDAIFSAHSVPGVPNPFSTVP